MANLFPDGLEEELPYLDVEEMKDGPIGYKPGISFDYRTGEFAKDGKNKVMESNGIESWKSWIVNCLQTERYAHLAYSTDFGVESEKIFRAKNRAEAESILVREVTEAIMADPYGRTDYVQINAIGWSIPDVVLLDMTIYGIDDVTIDINTYITKQGGAMDARI